MGSLSILSAIVIVLSIIYIGIGIGTLARLSEAISSLRGVPGLETTTGQLEQALAFAALTTATLFAAGALSGYLGIRADRLQNEIDELRWRIEQVGPPIKKDTPRKETQLRASRPTETLESPWHAEMEARRKAVEEKKEGARANDEETEKSEN